MDWNFQYNMITCRNFSFFFLFFFEYIFRLAEEHSMENPAYNKNHRFSDAFYNAHASQSEEYSEIQTNYVSFYTFNTVKLYYLLL